MEPLMALDVAAVWDIYGGIYCRAKGRATLVGERPGVPIA